MPLSKLDQNKKSKKGSIEDLQQKYITAPNEKLRKFYKDMLIKKGAKIPKL
jgi:hypothetical protein